MKTIKTVLVALLASTALLAAGLAQSTNAVLLGKVTLAWDPVNDPIVVGYRIHYGTNAGGAYTQVSELFGCCTGTVSRLPINQPVYFVATSVSDEGLESDYSNEVGFTITNVPPVVIPNPANFRFVRVEVGFEEPLPEEPPPPTNQPPVVSLSSPVDGTWFDTNSPVALLADAEDIDGAVDSVRFLDFNLALGTVSSPPPYQLSINLPIGGHVLTAEALDSQGATATSAPVNIVVTNYVPPVVLPCAVPKGYNKTNEGYGVTVALGTGASPYYATPFATVSTTNREVCEIQVELVRIGNLSGSLRASLWDGYRPRNLTGAESEPVLIQSLPAGTNLVAFRLPTMGLIQPGKTNWVVLHSSELWGTANDKLGWLYNSKASQSGGVYAMGIYRSSDTTNWTAATTARRGVYVLNGR